MWRFLSTTVIWYRLSAGLVLLGAYATGSGEVYRAYIDHQRRRDAIDHMRWDWTVPDDWYRQASS